MHGLMPVSCGGEAPPVYVESTTIPFLDLGDVNRPHRDALRAEFDRILTSGAYILGTALTGFEKAFGAYCGTKHCVGVGSGLDALTLVLRAWGIGTGDEVIVPSNTYIATWLAVSHCGARPVPVEPDPKTYNIDPRRIESAITSRTQAIIAVHLYGQPASMGVIMDIAARHGLKVIEDAAQAHGSRWVGMRVGGLGHAAAFSFYPSKPLGGIGDGGAVTTNDSALAESVRSLRNYGSTVKYHNEQRGFNSRLDELHAAFLNVKLGCLDIDNATRWTLAANYDDAFDALDVVRPEVSPLADPAWHLYVLRVRNRYAFVAAMAERGIETLIHYPVPPHRQPAYADCGYESQPIAESMADEVVSLPLWPGMSPEAQGTVIKAVREVLS